MLAIWALAYKLGGFGSAQSGFYREPLADPLAFARAAIERIPLLVDGPVDAGAVGLRLGRGAGERSGARPPLDRASPRSRSPSSLLAPLARRDRAARFFAFGAALSLLPIAAVGPQDRLLFFVGLGSMGLLAQLVHASFSREARLALRATALALLAVHLLLAPLAGLRWIAFQERASEKMIAAVASVPADPALAEQDLILVNPPDYVYG